MPNFQLLDEPDPEYLCACCDELYDSQGMEGKLGALAICYASHIGMAHAYALGAALHPVCHSWVLYGDSGEDVFLFIDVSDWNNEKVVARWREICKIDISEFKDQVLAEANDALGESLSSDWTLETIEERIKILETIGVDDLSVAISEDMPEYVFEIAAEAEFNEYADLA
jgi:hypothetical protein